MFEDISKVILATDMDGTLLPVPPKPKVISEKDLASIKRFQKAGGKFVLATGRGLQATEHFFDKLTINVPIIMYNGAVVYDVCAGKSLWNQTLPEQIAFDITSEIFKAFKETGSEVLRIEDVYVPRMTEFEREHMRIAGVTKVAEMPLEEIPKPWLKVLFADTPEQILEIEKFINIHFERYKNDVDFVISSPTYIEMLPKNVSKGTALEKLVEICGFQDYTVVSAGDYYNDIELLKFADVGFAPSNAQPEVKEIASFTLEQSCDENAISAVIDYIFSQCK